MPLVAGLAVGWFAVRRAREVSYGEAALTAALGALVCALVLAGLAAASSGPLGSRGLASFGPVWWATGAAAFAWTLLPAVPVAVAVHSWRTRPARQADASAMEGEDEWHDRGVRELRWEALRRAAGALIPDLAQDAPPAPAEPAPAEPAPAEPASAEPVPAEPGKAAPVKPSRRFTVVTGLHLDLTPTPVPAEPAPPQEPEPSGSLVPPVAGARVLARRKPPA